MQWYYLEAFLFCVAGCVILICLYIALIESKENKEYRRKKIMYKTGKVAGIKEQLDGYERIKKDQVKAPIVIENVVKGFSDENGLFIYVAGSMDGVEVCVSVPSASLDTFKDIDANDIEDIKSKGLKMYIESHTSKKGRQYYTAYIDA